MTPALIEKYNKIQAKAAAAAIRAMTNEGKALLHMATGTGKTDAAIKVIKNIRRKEPRARILWLTHRNELIKQARLRMQRYLPESDVGSFSAEAKEQSRPVVVASIPLMSRKNYLSQFNKNDFQYIFVDEAHHAPAATWSRIMEKFPKAKRFGITATPYRPDRAPQDGEDTSSPGVTDVFGEPAYSLSYKEAQKMGILSQEEAYIVLTDSVLRPIVTKTGEYSPRSLDRLHSSKNRNGIIVQSYLKYGRKFAKKNGLTPKALCFCVNARHAKHLAKQFEAAGVTAAFLVGSTLHLSATKREKITEAFLTGHSIEVLCVVDIFNEGVDVPDVSCILMTRPTRSNIIYQQQVGRGTRRTAKKRKFMILDYVDNCRREWQCYTGTNMVQRPLKPSRVITEYLSVKDPIVVQERVADVMKGVEEFEDRFRRVHTKETCMASAAPFERPSQWQKADLNAYNAAHHHGWLPACTAHMSQRQIHLSLSETILQLRHLAKHGGSAPRVSCKDENERKLAIKWRRLKRDRREEAKTAVKDILSINPMWGASKGFYAMMRAMPSGVEMVPGQKWKGVRHRYKFVDREYGSFSGAPVNLLMQTWPKGLTGHPARSRAASSKATSIPVVRESDGAYFNSMNEAAKFMKVRCQRISDAISREHSFAGSKWRYATKAEIKAHEKKQAKKKKP